MQIDVAEPINIISTTAIRRSSRESRSLAERQSLDAVFEAAKALTGAADPVSEMPTVFNTLASFMGLQHGALALLEDPETPAVGKTRNPYYVAATGRGAFNGPQDMDAIPAKLAASIFQTGVPVVSIDVVSEYGEGALPPHASSPNLAAIAVPIRADWHSPLVIGAVCVFRPYADDPAREVTNDLRVMNMIASLLEQSLRFRRAVARDRERMIRDAENALNAVHETVALTEPPVSVDGIIGSSPAISSVLERIRKVARTNTQVLLRGESGTGKELFARAIHNMSDRANKPFVKVNCAALSATLLETELFGHEKGSFTGATGQKKGRFELADGGTLFLDEIGEISHEFQTKLLRVLQEGEFERVGGTKTLKVDVRLITATNRDLESAVAKGKFRADLYFRICVVPIVLPPLRERAGDIPALAQTFLERFNETNGTEIAFTHDALHTLTACRFPGNVRELENCVNRAAALADGDTINAGELACQQDACLSAELWRLQSNVSSPIGGLASGKVIEPVVNRPAAPPAGCPAVPAAPRRTADTEKQELIDAMEQAGWVQAKAARLLGMTPRQIGYALKKHDISVKKF